jgi:hypothetical protein
LGLRQVRLGTKLIDFSPDFLGRSELLQSPLSRWLALVEQTIDDLKRIRGWLLFVWHLKFPSMYEWLG